jgi:microcystin-dependent protein
MTQPFLGQIQPFGFNFAPKGWAQCNGQILSITQNAALFSLIGTYYGGNGTSTFALPNLQSRVPLSQGTSTGGETFVMGEAAGAESVVLNLTQLPLHNHTFMGSSANGTTNNAVAGVALATAVVPSGTANKFYGPMTTPQPLNPAAVSPIGGNLPHTNLQPYLTINWCIALNGIFPSRG